ncbi:MAG: BatD family protein [Candidatus Symbiothrix sp.]|jgi:hypothetical protein|nr:BatD family protein [Candidatus Symbiothrix sp.]
MKKNRQIFISIVFWGISVCSVYAQQIAVKASIDSTHILIGEQTKIHLEIAAAKNQSLQLPVFSDTLITGIEVLAISKIDTTDIGNDRIRLNYDYLVTSFDSAVYLLPPFQVVLNKDTAYSNELALKVSTLPVDTESKQFYDIKDVVKPKFVLLDFLLFVLPLLYILLGILLIAAIVFIVYRIYHKKSLLPFKKEEPLLPHIRAIQVLDAIKAQKLWQQGKIKEYHSDITDALRRYIEERFEIGAMEMTSGEILDKIRGYSDADNSYDNLKQILILADFVKFAKYNPLPDENELSLMNAYLFVNMTKQEEVSVELEKKDGENKE